MAVPGDQRGLPDFLMAVRLGAAWLPQFSGSKRAEMVKMGLPHGITAVVTKDTLKPQTVGKLHSSPLDVYMCKTLIF